MTKEAHVPVQIRPISRSPRPPRGAPSTPTRCARYSALPWMSEFMPSAGMVMPSSDFGENRFFSASSNDFTRNTPFEPAPVTATRISLPRLLHEHADQREARGLIAEFLIGRLLRHREADLGDDFGRLERGREHAGEEIVGLDAALVGDDGGAEAEAGGRIIGVRIVIGDRAADGAAMAHRRIADHAGELGQHRDRLLHHRRSVHFVMAASWRRW